MAGQVGEADVAEGASQLDRRLLALGRVAGPERGEVDDGDLLDGDPLGAQGRRAILGAISPDSNTRVDELVGV
jgi:hypothetical protein